MAPRRKLTPSNPIAAPTPTPAPILRKPKKEDSRASGLKPEEMGALCRQCTPASLATFYDWCFTDRPGFDGKKMSLPSHLWPVALALCDRRINKLMIVVGPGAGKSLLLSVVFPAWLIGHDPNMTVVSVSAGELLPQGFMHAVMNIIETSESWKLTFPHIRPDKSSGWSLDKGATVGPRGAGNPDASYWACGLTSKSLPGRHGRLMIIDDIHNDDNSMTEDQIEKVVRKYYNTILGRADPTGARFVIAGRRWHENDIYGQLKDSGDWVVMTLPAERPGSKTLYYDVTVPEGVECVFTDGKVHCIDGMITGIDGCPIQTKT